MVLNELWDNFLKVIRSEVGNQVVETWFKSAALVGFDNLSGKLIFSIPNQFVSAWIRNNYLFLFKKHFPPLLQKDNLEFEFQVSLSLSSWSKKNKKISESNVNQEVVQDLCLNDTGHLPVVSAKEELDIISSKAAKLQSDGSSGAAVIGSSLLNPMQVIKNKKNSSLSSKYSFKNFVVGPHNNLAASAAQAIAKGCIKRYNPLFVYGKTGLGKTHLLHCIGNEFREKNIDSRLIYKNSSAFVDEFIQAIRQGKIQNFTDKYRKIDLLLIDDVQFFAQKEQTQEVFFHIFNRMYDEKKQIVLSSDTPPQQLSGFQERLISRFSWGLIADISTPTVETRIAILMKKAEDLKIALTFEVATFIAVNFGANVREMEGALIRLAAMTMLTFNPISLEMAKKELRFKDCSSCEETVKPEDIFSAVLKDYGLTEEDLCSRRRDYDIVMARQVIVYLLKKHTKCSLRMIGTFVGGRTHSTVLHAITKIEALLLKDTAFQSKMRSLENILN